MPGAGFIGATRRICPRRRIKSAGSFTVTLTGLTNGKAQDGSVLGYAEDSTGAPSAQRWQTSPDGSAWADIAGAVATAQLVDIAGGAHADRFYIRVGVTIDGVECFSDVAQLAHAAPVVVGTLDDQSFTAGTGLQTVDTAGAFAGEDLTYAVNTIAGATINVSTGVVSIPTTSTANGTIVVSATNSGGQASAAFEITILEHVETRFVMTIETTVPDETFTLPLHAGATNVTIDFGNGNGEVVANTHNHANLTATYPTPGMHTIYASGSWTGTNFNGSASASKVRTVENLGMMGWTTMLYAFRDCVNMHTLTPGNCDTGGAGNWYGWCANTGLTHGNTTGLNMTGGTTIASGWNTTPSMVTFDPTGLNAPGVAFGRMDEMLKGSALPATEVKLQGLDVTAMTTYGAPYLFGGMFNVLDDPDPIGIDQAIYDQMMISYAAQTPLPALPLGVGGLSTDYTRGGAAEAARNVLLAAGWVINDAGRLPPDAMVAPSVVADNASQITVTLGPDPNAYNYVIERYDLRWQEDGGAWTTLHNVTSPVTIAGLNADTLHNVQTRADTYVSDADGPSDWSPSGSATTDAVLSAPAQMAAPSLIVDSDTQITAALSGVPADGGSAITSYDLRWSENESSWTTITGVRAATAITGLAATTQHYVQIRAVNAIGAAVWSASATATTNAAGTGFSVEEIAGEPVITATSGTISITLASGIHAGTYTTDWDGNTLTVANVETAPVCFVLPTVSGSANNLTILPGLWIYSGPDLGDQTWQQQIDAADVTGGTGLEYEVVQADDTRTFTVVESYGGESVTSVGHVMSHTPTAPFAMAAPTLSNGTGSDLIVTFGADPSDNGGSAITDHDARYTRVEVNEAWTEVIGISDGGSITGLLGTMAYEVQTRANNAVGDGDWSVGATHITAATDATAPVLSLPTGVEDGETGATSLGVTTNEDNGTLYWGIYPTASTPSAADIVAGTGATVSGAQSVSATGVQPVADQTGLTASTAYKAHYVHDDAASNRSDVATTSEFRTDSAVSFTPDSIANLISFHNFENNSSLLQWDNTTAVADGELVGHVENSATGATAGMHKLSSLRSISTGLIWRSANGGYMEMSDSWAAGLKDNSAEAGNYHGHTEIWVHLNLTSNQHQGVACSWPDEATTTHCGEFTYPGQSTRGAYSGSITDAEFYLDNVLMLSGLGSPAPADSKQQLRDMPEGWHMTNFNYPGGQNTPKTISFKLPNIGSLASAIQFFNQSVPGGSSLHFPANVKHIVVSGPMTPQELTDLQTYFAARRAPAMS